MHKIVMGYISAVRSIGVVIDIEGKRDHKIKLFKASVRLEVWKCVFSSL